MNILSIVVHELSLWIKSSNNQKYLKYKLCSVYMLTNTSTEEKQSLSCLFLYTQSRWKH